MHVRMGHVCFAVCSLVKKMQAAEMEVSGSVLV